MHIGVSVALSSLPSQIEAMDRYVGYAQQLGLDSIEINFEPHPPERCYAPLPRPWDEDPIWSEVHKRLEHFRLPGAHLPFVDINPLDEDPYIADNAKSRYIKSIERAGRLGLKYGVIHVVGSRPGLDRSNWLPVWIDYLGELSEYARRAGLVLCVENAAHGHFLDDIIHIIRQVDSPWLRMTLDTGHVIVPGSRTAGYKGFAYGTYGSMDTFIRREHDLVYTMHIHDNNGKLDEHLVLGDGVGDFGYLKTLYDLGFDGVWTIEHRIDDDWDSIEVATRRLREMVVGVSA